MHDRHGCAKYDFELIKPLLNPWPRNLSRQPMRFDSLAMGVDRQAWLVDVRHLPPEFQLVGRKAS